MADAFVKIKSEKSIQLSSNPKQVEANTLEIAKRAYVEDIPSNDFLLATLPTEEMSISLTQNSFCSYCNYWGTSVGINSWYDYGRYSYIVVGNPRYTPDENTDSLYNGMVTLGHHDQDNNHGWSPNDAKGSPNPTKNGQFGYSVATSEEYVVIGAIGEKNSLGETTGVVYVYSRVDSPKWVRLEASDLHIPSRFGNSVAIDGDYIVIGAYYDSSSSSKQGSAYIFHNTAGAGSGNVWDSGTKIEGTSYSYSHFGESVDISGDYVVVGVPDYYNGSGEAWVFHRTGANTWDAGYRVEDDSHHSNSFGRRVSIHGDYISISVDNPSMYIYKRTGTNTWCDNSSRETLSLKYAGLSGDLTPGSTSNIWCIGVNTTSETISSWKVDSGTNDWVKKQELVNEDDGQLKNMSDIAVDSNNVIYGGINYAAGYRFSQLGNFTPYEVYPLEMYQKITSISNFGDNILLSIKGTGVENLGIAFLYKKKYGTQYNEIQAFWNPGTGTYYTDTLADDFLALGEGSITVSSVAGVGEVYTYSRLSGDDWSSQPITIANPNSTVAGHFGNSLASWGDYLMVDAQGDDTGKVYIYHKTSPSTWSSGFLIVSSDPGTSYFGNKSIGISNSMCIIGDYNASHDGVTASGEVPIYKLTGVNDWSLMQTLVSPSYVSEGSSARFGQYATIDEKTCAMKGNYNGQNKLYVFELKDGIWEISLEEFFPVDGDDIHGISLNGNYISVFSNENLALYKRTNHQWKLATVYNRGVDYYCNSVNNKVLVTSPEDSYTVRWDIQLLP